MYPEDLTGLKFGKLTVLKKAEKPKNSKIQRTFWLVRCECGTEKVLTRTVLISGNSKSCGCLRAELKSNSTHGLSKTSFIEFGQT